MKKTIMQEHLEWLKPRTFITPQIEKILIEQEKQQMLKCWNTLMVATALNKPIFFEDYYNSLNK